MDLKEDWMKKMVFFDIDGTLLDFHRGITTLQEEVKIGIKKLKSEGNYVFIATGRPYAFLNDELKNFGFDGFVLANGAVVMLEDKVIHSRPLEKEFVKTFVELLEENNIQYFFNGEVYSYIKESYKEFYECFKDMGISHKHMKKDYNLEEIDIFKIEIMCGNIENFEKCLRLLENYPEYDCFKTLGVMNLEIYHKENTKHTGILKALEALDIEIENSYAFGDGVNDVEMLSGVGCGIAMGNASDEVKKYAKFVTESVSENGVAKGIEKFILIEKADMNK